MPRSGIAWRESRPGHRRSAAPRETRRVLLHARWRDSPPARARPARNPCADRKSTRLNSSHANISYAVFCLKKKKIFDVDIGLAVDAHLAHLAGDERGVRRFVASRLFFFNDTATTEIYTLSLHDALPSCSEPMC